MPPVESKSKSRSKSSTSPIPMVEDNELTQLMMTMKKCKPHWMIVRRRWHWWPLHSKPLADKHPPKRVTLRKVIIKIKIRRAMVP